MSKRLACLFPLSLSVICSLAVSKTALAEPLPASMQGKPVRTLSLSEALQIAVQNNLGIRLQNAMANRSKAALQAAHGAFEPSLTARFDHSDSIFPPSTTLDGMAGDTFTRANQGWSLGLSHPLTWGTNLAVFSSNSRLRTTAGSAVRPLLYGTDLTLSVTQPLLRGFSFDRAIPTAGILRAEFANQTVLLERKSAIAREVKRTEDAYWELVRSLKSFAVQVASLASARQQEDLTKRQIAAGVLAPADLIASESAVAERELALVRGEASLAQAMDVLRRTLNLPTNEWQPVLLATDLPEVTERSVSLDEAMSAALSSRPEVLQYGVDEKLAKLDARVADNNRLPKVDVGAHYGLVGQDDTYPGSWRQVQERDTRNWGVFVSLEWAPLGRQASANARAVGANAEIAALRKEEFLTALREEVRGALRNLETAKRSVVASSRFRELAERSLDVERKRFLNGKSRNVDVSLREDSLTQAQTAELSAQIDFQKASTELDLATGRLLETKGIELGLVGK